MHIHINQKDAKKTVKTQMPCRMGPTGGYYGPYDYSSWRRGPGEARRRFRGSWTMPPLRSYPAPVASYTADFPDFQYPYPELSQDEKKKLLEEELRALQGEEETIKERLKGLYKQTKE